MPKKKSAESEVPQQQEPFLELQSLEEPQKPVETTVSSMSELDEKVYKWYTSLQPNEKYNIYHAAEQLDIYFTTLEQSLKRMQGKQLPTELTHITPS